MIFLILDILLFLLVVLFMPIGFWRGPVKELFVTLGIFFGIVLAEFWARPWGRDLSDMSELTADSGAFVVAMVFLIASTFVLGYGLGAALAPAWHETPTRALGAAVAALNGMLLLSFSLQYVRIFLLSDANEESLDDSYLSRFLLDQIGWVLMLAAFVAAPLLLFILLTGRRAYEQVYEDDGYDGDDYVEEAAVARETRRVRTADAATNVLPPRVPGTPREAPSAYKAEPEPRPRGATAETRPLTVAEPRLTAEPVPGDDRRMGDTDPHMTLATSREAPAVVPQPRPQPPAPRRAPARPVTPRPEDDEESPLAPGYTRCVNCHAVLPPETSICPNCGTLQ